MGRLPSFPEAPLSRTDDRRTLLLALGAAGVTLAVALGVIGLPAVNACSTDPRGIVTCLRDMADRKFDLPGTIPGQVAETVPTDVADPPVAVVAEPEAPAAAGGPLEAPAVEPAIVSLEPRAVPAPAAKPAEPQPVAAAPAESAPSVLPQPAAGAPAAVKVATAPELQPTEPKPLAPEVPAVEPKPTLDDTALSWSVASEPQDTEKRSVEAETSAAQAEPPQSDEPAVEAAKPLAQVEPPPVVPALPEPATPPVAAQPETAAPPLTTAEAPLVVANAEPAASQPPAPTVAAPVILAPTIDAIELDGTRSFVSGSGPAGALMRLYADGELIGESPVEEGRWLVEGSNLLDSPRRELRIEAIEPDTGKLLGVAAITVEIELPDGGAPPDERSEEAPEPGSGVAPTPQPESAPAIANGAPAPELADNEPPVTAAVPDAAPVEQPDPAIEPSPARPEPVAEPELAAGERRREFGPLPPLATVVPERESASVEILAPSTLQPTTLPPVEAGGADPSTITLPTPDAPALMAEFEVRSPEPPQPPGQPITMLRLLPFGDPDGGRYNVGKAIIRHGDTLWSIARRYYGHGIHYRTIFHANRELIRRPSRIFPGQIFDLPLVTDD
ncbi:hypothetical protein VW23_011950 [Devosia insulae DS-56]|uniref:LysM domain-containing protein n=1 Tax=Devosia insulae DS-56 TaxID=1116389 RepID=A0A1E5XUT9_9HYPH|nr:LysM peptidoglycan-binding domain-containing protein [Devosia insulae]OEO32349.1 hypothetical protein VW23_011950 [Devosia insulae DS-56]